MLLRDQIVIQIGEELDGMVMIRSGDNRQGVCPVKFLQEVWQRSEVACQANHSCFCTTTKTPPPVLNKIYYPNPTVAMQNNNFYYTKPINKKNLNSSNLFQYYYNNINNNLIKNNSYVKQINLNNNNKNFPDFHLNNRDTPKYMQINKAPFSSTKRPLSIRLSTPKHVSNFFHRTFRSDSQKRPLLLNYGSNGSIARDYVGPNFQIIPKKTGLKISSIYTISEDVEKFSLKTPLYRKNLYISSNSRPLFVRK